MEKLTITAVLAALCLVPIITGSITCVTDETPVIETAQNIYWACETDKAYCLSYMAFNNSLYQLNPHHEHVDHVGVIDKFIVTGGLVNPYFTTLHLRHNKSVTFGLKCGNDTLEVNVTPLYKEYYEVIDRTVWVMDNIGYILGVIFMAIMAIILATWFIKMW